MDENLPVDELLELLHRHRPELAVRVRGRLAGPEPARADALLLARAGLGEVLAGRQARQRAAERHRLATERELRRRVEQLRARRLAAAAEGPKRLRADLAELRLGASADAADGLRRLRDQARSQLEYADRAARRTLGRRVGSAANRLVEEITGRLDDALARLADEVRSDAGPAVLGEPVRPAGPAGGGGAAGGAISPVPSDARRWEDRALLVVGASAGFGLARLVVAGGAAVGGLSDEVTVPLTVGIGVAAAWWLARGRRAAQERAVLSRWVGEALSDLRARVDTVIAGRVTDAERRLGTLVDRAGALRVAEVDSLLRDQEQLASTVASRLARDVERDAAEVARLSAGCHELDLLLRAPRPPEDRPPKDRPPKERAA